MILVYFIVILLAGALLALIAGKRNPVWPRIISLVALSIDLILTILYNPNQFRLTKNGLLILSLTGSLNSASAYISHLTV
jgi:hypothetical protein